MLITGLLAHAHVWAKQALLPGDTGVLGTWHEDQACLPPPILGLKGRVRSNRASASTTSQGWGEPESLLKE